MLCGEPELDWVREQSSSQLHKVFLVWNLALRRLSVTALNLVGAAFPLSVIKTASAWRCPAATHHSDRLGGMFSSFRDWRKDLTCRDTRRLTLCFTRNTIARTKPAAPAQASRLATVFSKRRCRVFPHSARTPIALYRPWVEPSVVVPPMLLPRAAVWQRQIAAVPTLTQFPQRLKHPVSQRSWGPGTDQAPGPHQ